MNSCIWLELPIEYGPWRPIAALYPYCRVADCKAHGKVTISVGTIHIHCTTDMVTIPSLFILVPVASLGCWSGVLVFIMVIGIAVVIVALGHRRGILWRECKSSCCRSVADQCCNVIIQWKWAFTKWTSLFVPLPENSLASDSREQQYSQHTFKYASHTWSVAVTILRTSSQPKPERPWRVLTTLNSALNCNEEWEGISWFWYILRTYPSPSCLHLLPSEGIMKSTNIESTACICLALEVVVWHLALLLCGLEIRYESSLSFYSPISMAWSILETRSTGRRCRRRILRHERVGAEKRGKEGKATQENVMLMAAEHSRISRKSWEIPMPKITTILYYKWKYMSQYQKLLWQPNRPLHCEIQMQHILHPAVHIQTRIQSL